MTPTANSADHAARDHATWSASATARNWTCAGAIALNNRNSRPEVESEASAWGTACHQLAEKCFRTHSDAESFIGTVEKTKQRRIEVDEEVAETTQMYVDYVNNRVTEYLSEHNDDPIVVHEQALPLDRLIALLQREMNRLSSEPKRIRLFFDFWAKGFRNPLIRAKMQAELDRYREAFRPMAEEVLAAEPERFAHVTPEALAAVAVNFIKGCAVQSMLDPDKFDIEEYLTAAQALVGQLAPISA